MKSRLPFGRLLALATVAVLVAACAHKDESASKALSQVEAAVVAAGEDPMKYAPGDVAAVNEQIVQLKGKLKDGDYDTVIARAPALLKQAQALKPTAAEKKTEAMKRMEAEWGELESTVPVAIAAAQKLAERIVAAGKPPPGAGPDAMTIARAGFGAYQEFWQKAVDAKFAGDVQTAVEIGHSIERRIAEQTSVLGGAST
jgi:predicted component of type VI protein secretion system